MQKLVLYCEDWEFNLFFSSKLDVMLVVDLIVHLCIYIKSKHAILQTIWL